MKVKSQKEKLIPHPSLLPEQQTKQKKQTKLPEWPQWVNFLHIYVTKNHNCSVQVAVRKCKRVRKEAYRRVSLLSILPKTEVCMQESSPINLARVEREQLRRWRPAAVAWRNKSSTTLYHRYVAMDHQFTRIITKIPTLSPFRICAFFVLMCFTVIYTTMILQR